MHPALTIAKRAALSASRILLRHFDNLERLSVTAKQRNDFVSEADVQAEQEIIQTLRKTIPTTAFWPRKAANSTATTIING